MNLLIYIKINILLKFKNILQYKVQIKRQMLNMQGTFINN